MGGLTATSSLIHVYSCTESLSLSHFLSSCLPLLSACHLASSSLLLSLSLVSPSFGPSLVFLSLPVLCLSHANTPCAPADVVRNAKPLKGSHGGGRKPGAGKSHGRSPGSGSTKDTFATTATYSLLPTVSTIYSIFPVSYMRSDIQKKLNCGSDHILECPVRLEYWQSGSAQNCSHRGFLKTSVSEVVEVTYGPDCWFAFKSGSMSEDLSPFQSCLFYFTMGF